ncbi:hypothetical protein BCR32DRAFT_286630 [Anaeromyces robustus]|uniref:Uncharacterized protein n=1 Tax=Anaeromyces robustus TaxID=1754192 RepID=A0A1Y1VW45_9FUNG|nr:hypothetical protein BCR32DRAFT_286630 [Anaeromyces robustus]|eukprot:ORX65216.1 hypothetical protein BCR32DRAFT_286630 [Anaeromyces robustus]
MSSDSEKEDLVSSIKFEDYFKPEIYEINEEAEELRQKVKEELESELEVRDFAYASKDPRHWGLEVANNDLEESDISSEDNDSEVDFSSFNQWDNGYFVPFVDIDVEKFFNGVEKSKLIEYAFEKQKQDSDFEKSHEEDNGSKQDLSKMKLKIYNARSLFDFRKVTEWEMSLAEGETLFLIATEDPEEEIELPDELKDEINLDPDSNPNEKEDDKKKDDEKENEDDKKESTDNKKDSVNNKDEKLKSEEEILQSSDRIGSIDELTPGEEEDDPFTILSNQYNFPHPVNVEIRPHGFYYDLLQYIDYSSVYGNGWVLGIKAKIRCRRRFKNKKRLRKRRAIKMKLRVVDIGLIPENYVEVCSDSENEL